MKVQGEKDQLLVHSPMCTDIHSCLQCVYDTTIIVYLHTAIVIVGGEGFEGWQRTSGCLYTSCFQVWILCVYPVS